MKANPPEPTVSVPKAAHRTTRTYRTRLEAIAHTLVDALESDGPPPKNDSSKGAA
jgi:hypothetical protein